MNFVVVVVAAAVKKSNLQAMRRKKLALVENFDSIGILHDLVVNILINLVSDNILLVSQIAFSNHLFHLFPS